MSDSDLPLSRLQLLIEKWRERADQLEGGSSDLDVGEKYTARYCATDLETAVSRLRAETPAQWQPIVTTPALEDGLTLMVSDGKSVAIGEWCECDGGHWIIYGGTPHTIDTPTHWQTLPSSPAVPAPEKENK